MFKLCMQVIVVLTAIMAGSAWSDEFILLSGEVPEGQYQTGFSGCRVDLKNRVILESRELVSQEHSIQCIQVSPKFRKAIIWLIGSDRKKYITVADVDLFDDTQTVEMPENPDMWPRGNLLETDIKVSILNNGALKPNQNPLLVNFHGGTESVASEDIFYRDAHLTGTCSFEARSVQKLFYKADLHTGALYYRRGRNLYPLDLRLDAKSLAAIQFPEYDDREEREYMQGNLSCAISDKDYIIANRQNSETTTTVVLIYYQKKAEFSTIVLPGIFSAANRYGSWLVCESVGRVHEYVAYAEFTGTYYLHNLETSKSFTWETSLDTEILLVDQGTIYFRRDTKLKSIAFTSKEVHGEEETLIEDERLKHVHWMIPASGD